MNDYWIAIFHVDAATYDSDTYQTLLAHQEEAQNVCLDVVSQHTYESLNSPQGMAAAEDALLTALDELVMTLDGHDQPTIEMVALHVTDFEENDVMPGAMRKPAYPG